MSDAKTLFGLMVMFGFIVLIFGGMSVGNCESEYANFGDIEIPKDAWLPAFDNLVWFGQYLFGVIGLMISPCSGLGWLSILVMLPIGIVIAYLAIKGN